MQRVAPIVRHKYSLEKIRDVDVRLADFTELLITFVLGLSTAYSTAYIAYWLSVRRSKKEQFQPYLQKLYGIVSRIMSHADAEKLNERYRHLLNAAIDQEIRESAMKKLAIEPSNVFESFGSSFIAYSLFVHSFNDLVETIRECKDFEIIFSEMEKKGIFSTLKLRERRLHTELSWFHGSSGYVVEETKDIVGALRTTTEANDQSSPGSMSPSQAFQKLMMLSTHNLFHFGASLEKRLKKYV